jgi:hypothetical protein
MVRSRYPWLAARKAQAKREEVIKAVAMMRSMPPEIGVSMTGFPAGNTDPSVPAGIDENGAVFHQGETKMTTPEGSMYLNKRTTDMAYPEFQLGGFNNMRGANFNPRKGFEAGGFNPFAPGATAMGEARSNVQGTVPSQTPAFASFDAGGFSGGPVDVAKQVRQNTMGTVMTPEMSVKSFAMGGANQTGVQVGQNQNQGSSVGGVQAPSQPTGMNTPSGLSGGMGGGYNPNMGALGSGGGQQGQGAAQGGSTLTQAASALGQGIGTANMPKASPGQTGSTPSNLSTMTNNATALGLGTQMKELSDTSSPIITAGQQQLAQQQQAGVQGQSAIRQQAAQQGLSSGMGAFQSQLQGAANTSQQNATAEQYEVANAQNKQTVAANLVTQAQAVQAQMNSQQNSEYQAAISAGDFATAAKMYYQMTGQVLNTQELQTLQANTNATNALNLQNLQSQVGMDGYNNAMTMINSGSTLSQVNAQTGLNLTQDQFNSMLNATAYGQNQYNRSMTLANTLISAGGADNVQQAVSVMQAANPGVQIDASNLVTADQQKSFAEGMTQLSQLASAGMSWDEAQGVLSQNGALSQMGLSTSQVEGIYNTATQSSVDKAINSYTSSAAFQSLSPDQQASYKQVYIQQLLDPNGGLPQQVFNVVDASGNITYSSTDQSAAKSYVSKNGGTINQTTSIVLPNKDGTYQIAAGTGTTSSAEQWVSSGGAGSNDPSSMIFSSTNVDGATQTQGTGFDANGKLAAADGTSTNFSNGDNFTLQGNYATTNGTTIPAGNYTTGTVETSASKNGPVAISQDGQIAYRMAAGNSSFYSDSSAPVNIDGKSYTWNNADGYYTLVS